MREPRSYCLLMMVLLMWQSPPANAADAGIQQAAPLSSPSPAATPAALHTAPAVVEDKAVHDTRVQIVAETSAVIGAPMSGRLEYFPLRDGERFEKNAVIARFDCSEQNGALAKAKAAYTGKSSIFSTHQKLQKLGTSSALEYQTAQAASAEAKADLEVAQSAADHCEVKAPFAGRVAAVSVRNEQFVQTGAPLLEILSDSSLELQMILPSAWLSWIKPGTPFDITVDETGRSYHAEITRLSGKVDAVSQSIKAYGKLTNPAPELLPGMSGRTSLTTPQAKP